MLISLHKNATTTPATRLALQQATGTDRELAQQYGIGIGTVRKWRSTSTVHDASHTAHRLQTTLNAGQQELVIYLRSQLRLPLDDLLAVVREFIEPAMSRSALDRLLRRRGYSRLPVQPKPESEHKPFKAYEPGYVHVDVKYLPQMQDEDKRRYVFVAIDRATRWVFIDIEQHKTAASAKAFLAAVRKAAAFRIHTKRQRVHRPLVWQSHSPAHRRARIRPAMPSTGDRTSAHQAQDAKNQRHGRALQWPPESSTALAPLQQRRGFGKDAAQVCLAVSPPLAAKGTGARSPSSSTQKMEDEST